MRETATLTLSGHTEDPKNRCRPRRVRQQFFMAFAYHVIDLELLKNCVQETSQEKTILQLDSDEGIRTDAFAAREVGEGEGRAPPPRKAR